jgi:hypothetical protein
MATVESVARALVCLYETFVEIGHVDEDGVSWRQSFHQRNDLDVDACKEAGLSVSAIEFLREIPWYAGTKSAQLIPRSEIIDWSEPISIAASRAPSWIINPDAPAGPLTAEKLPPHVVVLSRVRLNDGSRGCSFTINVDTFEVRYYARGQTYDEAEPHPRDALDFIDTLIQSYRDLDMIPIGSDPRKQGRRGREQVLAHSNNAARFRVAR